MHPLGGTLLWIDHRLNHGTKDVGIDVLPVQFATLQDDAPRFGSHTGNGDAAGEESAVDVRELGDDVRGIFAALLTVHDVERLVQVVAQVAAIGLGVSLDGGGEELLLEDAGIFSKEAEQQAGDEDVEVVQVVVAAEVVVGTQLVV